MVEYEVTASGPMGYQVTAVDPEWRKAVVGDFATKADADEFARRMRRIDCDVAHRTLGKQSN